MGENVIRRRMVMYLMEFLNVQPEAVQLDARLAATALVRAIVTL